MPQIPFDPPSDRSTPRWAPADPFGEPRPVVAPAPSPTTSRLTGRRSTPGPAPWIALACAIAALIAVPVTLWLVRGIDLRLFCALALAGALDVIAVVLTLRAWRRPERSRRQRAAALAAGVLAACSLLGWVVIGWQCWQQVNEQRDRNAGWAHACVAGSDLDACDRLYVAAQTTPDQQRTAESCGDRGDDIRPEHRCGQMTIGPGGTLVVADNDELEPRNYGDDEAMDRLWDACDVGDAAACDSLYQASPLGSDYETFGRTCAHRHPARTLTCVDAAAG